MENESAIEQRNVQQTAALNCTFTQVKRNSRPALLARISVPIVRQTAAETDRLETLLDHAANLNIRLPLLKVSVKASGSVMPDDLPAEGGPSPYTFVLHGLFGRQITSQNLAHFLDLLTQDFNTFAAYAKAHNIGVLPARDKTQATGTLA